MRDFTKGLFFYAALILVMWGLAVSLGHEGSFAPYWGWALLLVVIGAAIGDKSTG